MTGWKREGSIEDFQEGKYDVMVANIRVIAKGFNLQNSNQILFYSNTYSLENRLQAEGRIFRIGQERACNYTDYVYADSIDEKIVLSLLMKQKLLDAIRGVELKELI
jgi:SNF2 family DNA or RNA helicase